MSLSKRERAMCLFSVEVLRAKVADAKVVLDTSDAEEESAPPATAVPVTPARKATGRSAVEDSPQTPDLSSRGPSAAASPAAPLTPPSKSLGSSVSVSASKDTSTTYTLPTLAALPASKILPLLSTDAALLGALGLAKADPLIVKATDELIDSLADLSVPKQKQQIGDKLFRVVKGFGIKGAVRSLPLLSLSRWLIGLTFRYFVLFSLRSRSISWTRTTSGRWRT